MREELRLEIGPIPKDQDHPRACGKNENSHPEYRNTKGSPPRMREEFRDENLQDMLSRITPAHAGRIDYGCFCIFCKWDHPRACGKNPELVALMAEKKGSPPRMREE